MTIRVDERDGIIHITHTYRDGSIYKTFVREDLTLTEKEFKKLYRILQERGIIAPGP